MGQLCRKENRNDWRLRGQEDYMKGMEFEYTKFISKHIELANQVITETKFESGWRKTIPIFSIYI